MEKRCTRRVGDACWSSTTRDVLHLVWQPRVVNLCRSCAADTALWKAPRSSPTPGVSHCGGSWTASRGGLRRLGSAHQAFAALGCRGVSTTTSTSSAPVAAAKPVTAQDPAASSGDMPVAPELLSELRSILQGQDELRWLPVSELYASLPPDVRRTYVKPHKTMLHVLQKSASDFSLTLSATGVYYAKGVMSTPGPDATDRKDARRSSGESTKHSTAQTEAPTPAVVAAAAAEEARASARSASLSTSPTPLDSTASGQPDPVDFFYDVQLTDTPKPPLDFDVPSTAREVDGSTSSTNGAVIALRDFVAYIPPFFVPVEEVVKNMPGYTAEHLEVYLNVKAIELVTVDGVRYVRLHGNYGDLSLDGCEIAERLYEHRRPLVQLVDAFVAAFQGTCDTWMPLPELLRRAGPAVVAQLPYTGTAAIMYFAQMQHRFAFAVRQVPGASGEAPSTTTEAAVLLRKPGYSGLDPKSTPTPKSFSALITLIHGNHQLDIDVVQSALSHEVQAELNAYYGGLTGFFAAHKPVFFVPPETPTVVMRTRFRMRQQRSAMSLEEQLRVAMEERDKHRIRTLRRKIAFRDDPSHPFHDPENLAKEVSKHLPRRGFVSMRNFLWRSVPEELLMFMPKRARSFFKNYPQYFVLFEHQIPGSWCLCRPDQPLPRGVIRQDFTEVDLVRLVAEILQQRGPRHASQIHLNLPFGAQEVLRRRYGGVYFFVIRYPEYFNAVLKTETGNMMSSAVIHLINVPNEDQLNASAMDASNTPTNPSALSPTGGSSGGEDDDDECDDGLD
ncbi:hypothetical protein NESM_000124800 [Novymonas esmeraldas]|uniref:Uncharacterized protein n=1 Tax=Novymonas esmeraldas TaxID=1808958 RepID=A0AAW0F3D2_9TRYP